MTRDERIERIVFVVDGQTVVGDLHLPAGPTLAMAVVAGPMTSVKEQVTGTYAAALARRGVAALAFDHRGYGESGGTPRQYEHAGRKIEDLRAAVDALAARAGERISLVGICLGAGYAAWAAVDQPNVNALACIAGYYRDVGEIRARDPEDFSAKVAQGVAARLHYQATGEVSTIPAAAAEGDAAMGTRDTVDYYTRRAAVANYRNAFALMSREHFLPFDVQGAASRLQVPTLMIHSERALSPHWARRFHDAIRAPKSLTWIDSDGQTDLYDDPRRVAVACDLVAAYLCGPDLSAGPSGPTAVPSAISAQ